MIIFGTEKEGWVTRRILTTGERRLLFGVPEEPDVSHRHYSLSRADLKTLADRRGDANRLGFAVQLALLRHPGIALAAMEQPVDMLTAWLAERLEIPVAAFAEYSRPATDNDRSRPPPRHHSWASSRGSGRPAVHDRSRGACRLEHRPRSADC